MRVFRFVILATLLTFVFGHTLDTDVGRVPLAHPDLGHDGGAGLHTKVRNAWTTIGDIISSRYEEFTSIADSTLSTHTHNFNIPFADLNVILWDDVGAAKTRIADPAGAGWIIAANGGDAKNKIDVTTPGSGGPHDFSVEVHSGLKDMSVQSSAAVSITGGDIDDIDLTDPVHDASAIFAEIATPANPAAGKHKIYFKSTDNKPYRLDENGVELELGSGAGAGAINYIANSDIESNADDYDEFKETKTVATDVSDNEIDLTAHGLQVDDLVSFTGLSNTTTPANSTDYYVQAVTDADHFKLSTTKGGSALTFVGTDDTGVTQTQSRAITGTGGSPTLAVARTTTGGEILRGTASLEITKDAASRLGEGFAVDYTVDRADFSKRLEWSFDWMTSANYVSGDMGMYLYRVTATAKLIPVSYVNLPAHQTVATPIQIYANHEEAGDYRIIWQVQTSNASAYTAYVDNVSVGPMNTAQGPPVSEFISWTPIFENDSTHAPDQADFYYQRVGSKIFIHFIYNVTATGTDASPWRFTLPDGISPSTLSSGDSAGIIKVWKRTVGYVAIDAVYQTGNKIGLIKHQSTALMNGNDIGITGSEFDVIESPGTISFEVAAWSGSAVGLTNSRVEYSCNTTTTDADDTANFSNSPNGCLMPNITATTAGSADLSKRVRFLTTIQSTDVKGIEILRNGETIWELVEVSDAYAMHTNQSIESYGIGYKPVTGSTTDLDVRFGRAGRLTNGSYAGTGSNYPQTSGDRYRVFKSSNPLSIGQAVTEYFEVKKLTADVASDTASIADFATTLTPGKEYRFTMNYKIVIGAGAPQAATLRLLDGGTIIGTVFHSSGSNVTYQDSFSTVRTMQSSAFTVSWDENTNCDLNGDNTLNETHLIIEEVDLVEGTVN